jgi:hypothetical protein
VRDSSIPPFPKWLSDTGRKNEDSLFGAHQVVKMHVACKSRAQLLSSRHYLRVGECIAAALTQRACRAYCCILYTAHCAGSPLLSHYHCILLGQDFSVRALADYAGSRDPQAKQQVLGPTFLSYDMDRKEDSRNVVTQERQGQSTHTRPTIL